MSNPSIRGSSRTIILLVLVAAVAVAGLLWWKTQHKVASVEAVTVRAAYAPVVLNLPSYVAQDRGMFAAKNVSTNFTVFNTANDMINAVVAGQVDAVTGVSLVPILHLEAQHPGKVRVVLHSKMTDACPYDGIVVKADSPIKAITDLPGHKVGLFPGTTALNLMKGFLKKHGVSADKIEFVQLPPPSHLSALESGAVDALLVRSVIHTRYFFRTIWAPLRCCFPGRLRLKPDQPERPLNRRPRAYLKHPIKNAPTSRVLLHGD